MLLGPWTAPQRTGRSWPEGMLCTWSYNPFFLYTILVSFPDQVLTSLIPRLLITIYAVAVEGLVKLLRRMTSGGYLEAWHGTSSLAQRTLQ